MLPFLKPRNVAGLVTEVRKADGHPGDKTDDLNEDAPLEACAEDLIRAVGTKDVKAVASAIRSAFEILDASPHQEGPHIDDDGDTE